MLFDERRKRFIYSFIYFFCCLSRRWTVVFVVLLNIRSPFHVSLSLFLSVSCLSHQPFRSLHITSHITCASIGMRGDSGIEQFRFKSLIYTYINSYMYILRHRDSIYRLLAIIKTVSILFCHCLIIASITRLKLLFCLNDRPKQKNK